MRKPFAAMMTLVLVLGSILSGVRSASPQIASAYAPPPPTLLAPTWPSVEPDQAGQSLPTPPSPDDLPPEVGRTRARNAIEAVLEKYLRYWGPRYQVAPVEVKVEGEWAHGVAQWESQTRTLEEPIHVLAHRLTGGIWQAMMPSSEGLYLHWVDAVPESLVPAGEKSLLRAQAAEADVLRRSQDLAVTVVLPSGEEPSVPVESVPVPAQPTATPVLQIQQTTVPLVLNTEDWLTYEDTNYGFAVRYPPNWFLNPTERSGGGEVATITSYLPNDVAGKTSTLPSVDFAKSEIGVFLHNKPTTQNLKEWTRPAEWMLPSLVQERELSINGVDTIQQTYHREKMFISTTYIPRGTKVYFVSITTLAPTLPIDVLAVLNSFTYTMPYNEPQNAVDHLYPQDSFEFLGNVLPMAPVGFRLPFDGSFPISNGPGEGYHTGSAGEAVDFPMVTGTAVKATEVGNVTFADWDSSGYGWSIKLHHDNGMDSWYAHLSTIQVSVGQHPSKGQQIALSGSTGGTSTGPHLHFHVKSGSSPVCIRDLSDIWWNTWFPPGDPNYYSGCACYPPCGSPPGQCYQDARRLSCGGGSDTTPPDGDITSPGEGDTITSRTVHLAGWAQDNAGGSGFNHAHFTAYYNGGWREVGPDFTSSPFGFDWDMCNDEVPNGPVTIGLDIWDNEGNQANSPHGVRHFTKNFNCGGACPQSGGVILYWNANYDCNNNEGDPGYRQRTSIGWQNVNDGQFNDKASSVKVPPDWSVRLFAHADRGEPSVCFNTDVGDFGTQGNFPGSDIPINDNVSSIEVFDNSNCGSTIDDAEFVGQSPYPTVQAGQPFSVYFEVRNTGNTTWRDSDGYGLENTNGQPLGAWERQEIGSDVPPGATKRWDIQMTAPSSPGVYRTQWMLNHWGNTFGPNMFIDVTVVPASVDDAEFVGQSPYPTIQAGQQFSIYFEVRNTGDTTWRDSDGYGLENINGQPLGAWHRQEIGSDVPPGATRRWDIQMTAPSSPGLYQTQWMLNHWGNTFGPNMFIDVTVVPAPDPPTLVSPSDGATLPDDADITLDWNSSSVATEYYAHLWGGPSIDIDSDWIGSTDWHIGQLWPGTYSWQIQARNQYGESNWSSTWSFTVAEPVAIGPLVYDSHTVDDDDNDQSSGDGDGIVECGESIELYVTLSNLGDGIATGVNATISTSDPYVTWLYDTSSSYPDIPSGGTGTNSNDFDFAVDSSIPDGHVIQFDLNINASNGGPWSDSFDSTVVCPRPDLHPYAPPNYPYPVVPSSTTGTHEVNMLVADPSIDTYFDWHFINDGSGVAPGTFYVELWVDGTRHVRYPQPDFQPGWVGGFDDWAVCISEPGWHTVRLIADPDDNVDEANETNNVWERQFYWASGAPYAADVESGTNDWTATGLWHQVDQYTSPYPESRSWSHSWWYGQDGTGDYDADSGNSGHLTSPPVYIPSAGYYLRFWSWYETETHGGSWDTRWIQISADGGEFENVLQLVSDPMQEWTPSPAIDLSSYAGSVIQFRLDFDTVDSAYNGYRGWYADDFSISSTPPPVCSDSHEPNNWTGEATFISYGDSLDAQVCPQGDLDFYAFSGAVGSRIIIDIDARVSGSNLDSYVYLLDSDGSTYLAENDDAYGSLDSHLVYDLPHDGTYYIKVRTYSHPNSGGVNHFYTLHLLTDNVNPTTQITSPTSDGYLDVTPTNITVEASDDESGVSRVEFLWHDGDWQNSDWVWLGADWDGSDGWSYEWDTSAITDQSGIALYVWAFDWAGNWTGAGSWGLTLDRTPPAASASVSPMYGDAPFRDFHVWWHGSDDLSGIAGYDVQYRDGAGGTWTDLLTNTDDTNTRFVGFDGHTYYFRARARDRADNQSAYAGGDGDVQHTVEICHTPLDAYEVDDTRANARWIVPDAPMQMRTFYAQGDRDWARFYAAAGITYTLMTINTGGHADTVLYLYDSDGITLITSNDDAPGMWPASRIDWQPSTGGFYWAKVEHWDPWAYGCTTEYGLSVLGSRPTPFSQVYLPLVVRNLGPSYPPPTAVETLNFRVSFYGRDNGADEPQNVPIKVTIKDLSLDHVLFESGWVAVTPAGGSSNWGTASVDVSSAGLVSGHSYQVFVRGAMHLAKRAAVSLAEGMIIDYTDADLNPDAVLWTCDVNQDNQVNREDLTKIISHYGETAPTNPVASSEVYRSDQNGDGMVNGYDMSICINSYGKAGDPY